MSFPKYEKYKDSGVESIGLLPLEWNCAPLKYTTRVYTGNSLNDEEKVLYDLADESAYPYISSKDIDVNTRNINYNNGLRIPKENKQFKIAPKGSFLLCIEGGSAGKKVGLLKENVCFVNKLCCFSGDLNRFKYYFVQSLNFKSVFQISITGLIGGVSTNQLKNFNIPIPPHDEVLEIVKFLDCETAKIDELVAEQQRLIEMLKEKRQAVISHAVTRGLNPNVKLKPSGIEWLADVPVHWEVTRVANVFCEVAEAGTDDLPILSVSIHHGVSDKEIAEEDMERKVMRSEDRTKYKQVVPGDLVYNMMRAWQGGFGVVTVAGMVSPAYVVARPKRSLETAYVEHLLRTPQAIEQMRRHSRGVTDFRLRLYWDEFKNLAVAVPPRDEAKAICAYIAEMDKLFKNMTAVSEQSINLLQERRTALISAAVTGKIDVRQLNKN